MGGHGVESLGFAIPFRLPIAVPDALLRERRASDARSFAIGTLIVPEVLAIDVSERGMGKIQILHGPDRLVVGAPILPLTEENQFESEPFTMRVRHITGVIPPFGAKVLMFEVIAWETGNDSQGWPRASLSIRGE